MSKLVLLESNVIYRNPYPGHQAVSAFHPFALRLSEREPLCSFKHGQAICSRDGMTHIARSLDGGKTRAHEGQIVDRSIGERYYQYGSGQMTRLRDGFIVLAGMRCDRTDPTLFYANPKTGGSLRWGSTRCVHVTAATPEANLFWVSFQPSGRVPSRPCRAQSSC